MKGCAGMVKVSVVVFTDVETLNCSSMIRGLKFEVTSLLLSSKNLNT